MKQASSEDSKVRRDFIKHLKWEEYKRTLVNGIVCRGGGQGAAGNQPPVGL